MSEQGLARWRRLGREHLRAAREAWTLLRGTGMRSVLGASAIGFVMALPALLFVVGEWAQVGLAGVDMRPTLTAFLRDDAAADVRDALCERLTLDGEVARITLIEAKSALAEFAAAANMEAAAFTGDNPLPDVLEVEVERATWRRDRGAALALRLQQEPLVAAVYRAGDWVERLDALVAFGHRMLWVFAVVIGVGVLLLVGNVVGGLVNQCVDEIEVRALVGATAGFIRRPFLYAGAVCGVAGAALACALVALAMTTLSDSAERVLEAYGGGEPVAPGTFAVAVGLLVGGLVLGWSGAWLGCSGNLRRFEAHLD